MGQAKNRGSFDERQSKAVVAKQKQMAIWEQEKIRRQAAMTPEDRKRQHGARMVMAMALGLSASYQIQHIGSPPSF